MLVKLEKYLEIKRGPGLPSKFYSDSGSLIRLTLGNFNYPNGGFKENNSKKDIYYTGIVKNEYILKKGDLITPLTEQTYGLLGTTAWIPEDNKYIQNGDIGLVLPFKGKLDNKFCYYLLSSRLIKDQLSATAQQTKIRHTSPEKIKACLAIIPPFDIQKKIGILLSSIDCQIERNNNIVKRLQVLAHAIFNRFFYSENNLIPLVYFPYIQAIKPGIIKFDNKKHYIATAEIEGEQFNYNAPLIEYKSRENRANMQPILDSVWFAKMKNSIKHIYVTQNDKIINQNYIFSTGFCGIKCEEFAFEYMANYLNLSYFEKKKDITSHGATMEGINNEDLKSFKIHLPTKDKLILFHNKTKEIYYEMSRIRQVAFQLTRLKDKLLPLLINGQLK